MATLRSEKANEGCAGHEQQRFAANASHELRSPVTAIRTELEVAQRTADLSAANQALQQEVGQLVSELDRISQTTEFNGSKLLDGSFTSQLFQVGANAGQAIAQGW